MRRAAKILVFSALLIGGVIAYTKISARLPASTPPEMASIEQQADFILVEKSARKLTLMREGEAIGHFNISLGADGDGGHKLFEGDERTPEGLYTIDWRNPKSIAHLSLHISYPNAADVAQAQNLGKSAGGNIMIHGLPNGWGLIGKLHLAFDWTNGCIAITNAEMQDVWSRVPNGTKIEIRA
ncbi:MAG: L,D-transpeptidase family protein [Paracoccaceae bacterium]